MLIGISKIPKIPMGQSQSPSYCLTDIPIQAAGQKTPQIGIIWFIRDILHNFAATQRECVPAPRAGGPYSK